MNAFAHLSTPHDTHLAVLLLRACKLRRILRQHSLEERGGHRLVVVIPHEHHQLGEFFGDLALAAKDVAPIQLAAVAALCACVEKGIQQLEIKCVTQIVL